MCCSITNFHLTTYMYATSITPDQPMHPCSAILVYTGCLLSVGTSKILSVIRVDCDETVQVDRDLSRLHGSYGHFLFRTAHIHVHVISFQKKKTTKKNITYIIPKLILENLPKYEISLLLVICIQFNPCHATHFKLSANQITLSRLLTKFPYSEWQRVQNIISRLLQKPTDIDLHCL